MHRHFFLLAALSVVALGSGLARAQNLLINGDLDDPGIHESDIITGWTLLEGPDGAAGPTNTATAASFANHTPGPPVLPPPAVRVGLWYRSFQGGLGPNDPPLVFAHLQQTVPGVPGLPYTMSGWARFEANYPGGVAGDPTDTIFALEFLDAGNNVLAGSVSIDLFANGQVNGADWMQHSLFAVAPAGTVNVRVRSSMIDGHLVMMNPQSAFVDDFSLVIPEPASLGLMSLSGVALLARRRSVKAA